MKCTVCQNKDFTMYSRFRVDRDNENILVGIYICGKHGATEEDLEYLLKSGVTQQHITDLLPGLIEYTLKYRSEHPDYYEEVKKSYVEYLGSLDHLLKQAKDRVKDLENEIAEGAQHLGEFDA